MTERSRQLRVAMAEAFEREIEVYHHLGGWFWRRRDGTTSSGPFADAREAQEDASRALIRGWLDQASA